MNRSSERILTTHTGSLPRPDALLAMLMDKEAGRARLPPQFDATASEAVRDVIDHQRACGVDVVNDGEMAKPDYSTYIKDRVTGFDGEMVDLPQSREPDILFHVAGNLDCPVRLRTFGDVEPNEPADHFII